MPEFIVQGAGKRKQNASKTISTGKLACAEARARAFAEYNIFWLEEPLRPDDYEGYRRLSEATEIRIAAGEEESNRGSYLELMDKGKIDVVQAERRFAC